MASEGKSEGADPDPMATTAKKVAASAGPAPAAVGSPAAKATSTTPAAAEAAPSAAAAAAHARRRLVVLYIVSMNAILVTCATSMFIPGMKQVETDLDTSTMMVGAVLTSYMVGQGVQPLISGPLSDRIGRRTPMLIAHMLFFCASIACAVAPSIYFLIGARVVQAMGGTTFLVVGQAQVADSFPRSELSEALAIFSLSRTFAAMVGPVLGGLLCELFDWRATFWACAIMDSGLFLASLIYVPETLVTPKESRPKFTVFSVFQPLKELRNKSVGLLCLLSGANHGLVYLTLITIPKVSTVLTNNEFIIGMIMLPCVSGTLVGTKIAGKVARPRKLTVANGSKCWESNHDAFLMFLAAGLTDLSHTNV